MHTWWAWSHLSGEGNGPSMCPVLGPVLTIPDPAIQMRKQLSGRGICCGANVHSLCGPLQTLQNSHSFREAR